jgi:hypothetical protein
MTVTPQAAAAAACLALAALVSSSSLSGQSAPASSATSSKYSVPRTPWGDPDLQGKWPSTDLVGVPMQRDPKLGTRTELTEDEFKARQEQFARQAAQDEAEFDLEQATATPGGDVGGPVSPPPHWLERGTPQYQASLIVDPSDGRMPPFTAEALQRQAAQREAQAARRIVLNGREADTYLDRSLYDRCVTRGIAGSILPVIYNNGNEIVQGPGWVAIRNEMIHETRIVPLDGRPHPDASIRMWMGDSRGRWEGDTLVVETTNFDPRTSGIAVNGGGARISDALKVTERFTRVSADLLSYEMKVEDPKTWTRPWTMRYPLRRDDGYGFYEYACHEGNYSMFNILSGARALENIATRP